MRRAGPIGPARSSWSPGGRARSSDAHLAHHVIQHRGVLDLRAEENDFRVLGDPDAVARRPIEDVRPRARLLRTTRVVDDELTGDDVKKARAMLLDPNMTKSEVARHFKVTRATLNKALARETKNETTN